MQPRKAATGKSTLMAATGKDNKGGKEQIIHMNHAGASPSPSSVINRVIEHMELEQEVGGYSAAQCVQEELHRVYNSVARLLHASSFKEIALVESATVAWTRLFYSMIYCQKRNRKSNKTKHVILVSEAEYAANMVAACQWARDYPDDWTVVAIPSTRHLDGSSTGVLDVEAFRDMLEGKYFTNKKENTFLDPSTIAIVCVTHVPTNSGIVNPVEEVGQLIAHFNKKGETKSSPNILYLVDACQSIGQMDVNVQTIQCHGLTGTGRKYVRGPRGTGFLFVSKDIVQELQPHHVDHACAPVTRVPSTDEYCGESIGSRGLEDVLKITYKDGAKRFEFWESNLANKLGLGLAVEIAMDEIELNEIEQTCYEMACLLKERLRCISGVKVHHDDIVGTTSNQQQCGLVTFQVDGVAASSVKESLWQLSSNDIRFEVSVVPATSTPLDSATCQVPDLVRASLSYTNTIEEIEAFCERLKDIVST